MNSDPIKKDKNIRVRMAPSPTGALHVGTARAALFNYLFVKHYGGEYILRIEDTDQERSDVKWEKDILDGLSWLGIEWDAPSGEITEGQSKEAEENKIIRQSERVKDGVYRKYLKNLLEEGRAFYCWHTQDELQKERQKQQKNKEAPKHVCEYRDGEVPDKDKIKNSIIRFKNNSEGSITFEDLVRGEVTFNGRDLGDFSIAKNLDSPLYNFAVVVDDHEMEISHVIRGEDHISNTPRQILIQEALGISRPKFAHLPLILGPDKSKLSKRHGATSVNEYRGMGYLPEALFNFLALLGWRAKEDEKEIMSRSEIIEEFSVDRIQQAGAVFDIEKLGWMNGQYIRQLPLNKFAEACIPFLKNAGLIEFEDSELKLKDHPGRDIKWLEKVVAMEQDRIKKLSEISEATEFVFKEIDYESTLLIWKDMKLDELSEILLNLHAIIKEIPKKSWDEDNIKDVIMPQAELTGSRGKMLWPLRVAVSGRKASPGPFEIMEVLGKELTLKRVEEAHQKIKNLID